MVSEIFTGTLYFTLYLLTITTPPSPLNFSSLVKMLYWMCEQSQSDPTGDQLEHAIKRNFGGHEEVQAYEKFKSKIPELETRSCPQVDMSEEVSKVGIYSKM